MTKTRKKYGRKCLSSFHSGQNITNIYFFRIENFCSTILLRLTLNECVKSGCSVYVHKCGFSYCLLFASVLFVINFAAHYVHFVV